MDNNKKILAEISKYVPEGYTNIYDNDIAVSKGRGSFFYDFNGKKYIDFTSGIFTNSFGHCHMPLVLSAFSQKLLMDNVHGRRNKAELEFYTRLADFMPDDDYRFIPYNDGGYAIDRGLSDIVNYYEKKRVGIAAFRGGFHGKTMGAKLTINKTENATFFDNFQVDFPNCYRCPKGFRERCGKLDCVNDICGALKKRNAKALIFEPIQGAGIIIPPEGFWEKIERFCKSKGIVMFADEILTGGGRTGHFLASYGNYGITPDMIAITKGLANGHPLSVLCEKKYITENQYAKRPGERSSTFAAHPEGLAIASAVLKQLKKHDIFSAVTTLEPEFRGMLENIKSECAYVGDVRCIGLAGAVELVKDRDSKTPFLELGERVFEKARNNGLEVIPSGHIIRLAPPLNIKKKTLTEAMRLLKLSIKQGVVEIG